MRMGKLFENVSWPSSMIYNVTTNAGSKAQGGADVEHVYIADGNKNVWLQRHTDRVVQAAVGYAEQSATGCFKS